VALASSLKRLSRRRHFVGFVGAVAIVLTFAMMAGFHLSGELGALAFAPWVALVGFDGGLWLGIASAGLATGLWQASAEIDGLSTTDAQLGVRGLFFAVLAAGTALAGNRLRESQRAYAAALAQQSALLDSTVDGISLTDAEGNLLIMNRPIVEMAIELGMPPEGTVPERLLAIAERVSEPERYRRRMLELARNPTERSSDEFELTGSGRVFRGYAAPVNDAKGRFIGRIWTLREVTADRELDRMRDAFVATVSHELRTPLTSISGFLEMMADEADSLTENARTYLDVIGRSAQRLQRLVEDLLLIAQIEARRLDLHWQATDLAALATECIESTRPIAEEKGIALVLECDHPPEIMADPYRISQILDNLVSNALKFTSEGGSVTVRIEGDESAAQLVVSDTGIGIPEDEQPRVFSRFFRSQKATQNAVPGTGLGLAISRALVERHGGRISLESTEGEGTRVTVTLPV
jgi:signal transduction histidine kinase